MSHTNAAWRAVEEHCPWEDRPGSATETELWLDTVMTMYMDLTALQWSPSHCNVGGSD